MAHKFISATHNKKTLTAMYKMADGTIYIRKGGTIPWRLQNPGDVRPNKSNASEYLQPLRLAIADTASGQFSMFGSEEDGWETKKKLLRSSLYRDCTVSDMAKVYAPKEDGNDPERYAKEVLAESGVSPSLTMGDMDDATLERVMEAMKKEEGYYNLKETRVEKWVYTTNISVTDGIRPVAGVPFKATLGTCEYSCKTDKYGKLAPIVHKTEGMNIEVKAANAAGEYETAYSAQAGNESKNILLKRNFVQYKAHTLAHNPEPPHEKSQPKPTGYIIQSGDTLSEIAARYEVSVSELTENNGIKDPNKIYPGQRIVIYGKKGTDDPVIAPGHIDGDPVDGPLSLGGWTPDATGGSGSSPAETGGATPSGTGESYPLPPYPESTSGTDSTGHPTVGAGGQKSDSSQTTATPNKPINVPTVGSKNSGRPVAPMGHEQRDAPWMVTAIAKAEKYKGADESIIEQSENFHSLCKVNWIPTMVGRKNAWCASFINYCLQVNNYAMWSEAQRSQDIALKKNKGSFIEIKEPVYGCMVMLPGHVTLMYGLDKNTKGKFIGLGGNQGGIEGVFGGTIRFSSFWLRRA
ncbi:LysM peptidoglycan-binding domain-containing protein, partial [Salmonella enterica]|nr:LysM peptidoglycan-binding domain-containing protein [Salmonella enterica]